MTPPKILLAEDGDAVRAMLQEALQRDGFEVLTAASVNEALSCIIGQDVDVLLMDLHMPRMNGWDAMVKIRAINPEAKIVLLSGGSMQDLPQDLKAKGAMAVLQKPFENIELVQLVRRILDKEN